MNFPDKNLSLQHVSQSYQGLVQTHGRYLLNGLGDAVVDFGNVASGSAPISVLQSDATASMLVGTASVAINSIVSNFADTASYSIVSEVSVNSVSSSYSEAAGSSSYAATASYLFGSIESASYSRYSATASYAPNYVKKTGDVMTGDLVGTDFIRTRSGTITRDGDGNVSQVSFTGGRTLTYTRTNGYVTSATDGSRTWTYQRDGSNRITSWEVTTT